MIHHLAPARPVARLALAFAIVALLLEGIGPQRAVAQDVAARAAARPAVRYQRAGDLLLAATATARAWSPEAQLVYVENADSLALDGSAKRWTFIYASPERAETRAFTLGEGGATSV